MEQYAHGLGSLTIIPVPRKQTWAWLRHQMETFSRVTGHLCGNSPVTGEFPTQRPVTRSFDVVFDLRQNKRLSKQTWGWWFETPSHPLWRNCNDAIASVPRKQTWGCMGKWPMWITRSWLFNCKRINHKSPVCIFHGLYYISQNISEWQSFYPTRVLPISAFHAYYLQCRYTCPL